MRPWLTTQRAEALRLWLTGLTAAEVGAATGRTERSIRGLVKRQGASLSATRAAVKRELRKKRQMSRDAFLTDLKTLLRKHAARFVNDLDEKPNFTSAKQRLEQMVALIESVGQYDR